MLDSDLARLYGVTTSRLNEQVKRNIARFPKGFAFQLSRAEFGALRSQIATLNDGGRGKHRKYLPYVFTEHAFQRAAQQEGSRGKYQHHPGIHHGPPDACYERELARKVQEHDQKITILVDAVQKLLMPPASKKNPSGTFIRKSDFCHQGNSPGVGNKIEGEKLMSMRRTSFNPELAH